MHRKYGKLCTVAAVQPPERFGSLSITEDGRVVDFREKAKSSQWINAGFFVCEPGVLEYIDGDRTQWEREPMECLAKDGELLAYRHLGFWACMDTDKDRRELENLWRGGAAPWKTWV
jgi:glucose-1-phosphate cytidylyltransferase